MGVNSGSHWIGHFILGITGVIQILPDVGWLTFREVFGDRSGLSVKIWH